MPALVYAPIPPPEPEVIPDPPPVQQPHPDGGLQNVKERVYVFLNRYLKVSPKYSTTHDGELHRELREGVKNLLLDGRRIRTITGWMDMFQRDRVKTHGTLATIPPSLVQDCSF
jgi:hypothetical protein